MNDLTQMKSLPPVPSVECLQEFKQGDLDDLCDATDAAIKGGGGFGWVDLPSREILERYWSGVLAMPARILIVARLDGVICGTCQLVKPAMNNEAQKHIVHLNSNFIAPWARGHGLSKMLLERAEHVARDEGFAVINLDVRASMETAIRLYEGMGFIKFGEHPCYAQLDGEMISGFYYYKTIRN